jgi:hypothetical protein
MKRIWLVLLSLGLVMAFSVSALAVDVKSSGEYYAAGMLLRNVNLTNDNDAGTHFFYQRFRLGTDFIVSPCLKLVTRVDVMERTWEPDSTANYASPNTGIDRNFDFDIVYVDYTSPIGLFQVGYMPDYVWGNIWSNRSTGPTSGQIKYIVPIPNSPITLVAAYAKEGENSYFIDNTTGSALVSDRDYDSYRAGGVLSFKGGEAGLLFIYNRDASHRGDAPTLTSVPYLINAYSIDPYFKAKVGPLALQGEAVYQFGKIQAEDPYGAFDMDINSLTAWLDADANFGIFSIGGSLAYASGDDDATDDEKTDSLTGGRDWDPCLIMFNNTTMNTWVGPLATYTTTSGIDGEMKNALFGQLRASLTPVPEFTGMMSVSYAMADKAPKGYDDNYGYEVDVTGTYKITNNLSYMLGFGYLFTGDYYKGTTNNDVEDDYIILNKLTLNF